MKNIKKILKDIFILIILLLFNKSLTNFGNSFKILISVFILEIIKRWLIDLVENLK